MLEVVGGQRPERHSELLGSQEYLQELHQDDLCAYDPDDAPGHYQHLKYLSNMLTVPDTPDYSEQVCCLSHDTSCLDDHLCSSLHCQAISGEIRAALQKHINPLAVLASRGTACGPYAAFPCVTQCTTCEYIE